MSNVPCCKRIFCSLVFVALLVACCSSWSTAWAQAKPKTAPATKPLPVPELPTGRSTINRLIADRHSCSGPTKLISVTPQGLVFPGKDDENPMTISLAGKSVTVMDQAGNTQSLSALRSGIRVIVCQKADSMVVIITPEKKRVGNARY
jgi:hypothetical protein